ncbi:MAG: hypothetical protein AAGF73_15045 [Actinomycetota bacterium]
MTSRTISALAAGLLVIAACGDDGDETLEVAAVSDEGAATFEFEIPPGAGAALDAGEPLEVLPGELIVEVGDTIRIVNDDERGHNVGPFFVGAGETLTQQFASPGEFVGVCTVHPSGELVLTVEEPAA